MDFRLSPAQQLLVSTARDFLRKHCPPELVQRVALDARGVDDAHVADALVVGTRAGGDTALLLVPTDRRGIARWPLETIGLEKRFEVAFDDVAIGTDDRLEPAAARRAALAAGALARTAEMVGAAQRVLELAVEHAKTRVQGGRPIGGHQAIQHACADPVRDVGASRSLLHAAGWNA